ncbi:MAG: N-acetylmuramoyl-L-alanine amidase [Parvibaculaceae bacterium]|nr:N-acetylmuramoyl-L-alanine amidase [Parvibaculaceae bacterium]
MSLLPIIELLSPNTDERPAATPIDMLVLHYTGMASSKAALDRLRDPQAKVSAHYMVEETGAIFRLAPEQARAWHAGVSNWKGRDNLNGRSIGIEIVNGGHDFGCPAYPAVQMEAVAALSREIMARHPIRADNVVAHSDIAPTRKQDPGEWFDWRFLHARGVGLWAEPEPILEDGPALSLHDRGDPVAELQYGLASYGYGLEVLGRFDEQTRAVIAAFQRHFRPERVDGIADLSTVMTLKKLIEAQSRVQAAASPTSRPGV